MTIQEIAEKHGLMQIVVCHHKGDEYKARRIQPEVESALRELLEACCAEVEAELNEAELNGHPAYDNYLDRLDRGASVACNMILARLRELGGE